MSLAMKPGLALMRVLTTRQKIVLQAVFFGVGFVSVTYLLMEQAGVDLRHPVFVACVLCYLLGNYFLLGRNVLIRSIFRTLREEVERFSSGDLRHRAAAESRGEAGMMLGKLQEAGLGLSGILEQVRASAETINHAAREVSAGHVNLSQRTEQQASTLEETASGMEELSGTVKQNADNCKLASGLAESADRVAREGAKAVHGVFEEMGKIDQSSKRMADIIGVIEGIAFQTNILALNAAVEAARAGEQGRGFAVVASEVRALAQRSAEAAKEIKALIQQSVEQISDGSKKAEGAGKVIDEIVVSVQQVNQLIGEIAVASSEQSAGVAEINKALAQLESVTQQNAALVEEAAASSLTFQEQADRMGELVARFKIAGEPPAAPPRPARAPSSAAVLRKVEAAPRPRPLPKRPLARQAAGAHDEWKEF